ncbi:MAG: V-type ATP synthase subunit C [Clostridiaceae bacterium]|nr:V-type ATP synthase subunit C [Clostridiaceae bacterium]
MPGNTQYAYGVGRIRVIEKRLIDKAKFDRMIEAKTTKEALKMLNEAGYGEPAPEDGINPHAYEKLIREEQKKLYNLIRELTDGAETVNIFLLRNDYRNVKVLLKSEFLGMEAGLKTGAEAGLKTSAEYDLKKSEETTLKTSLGTGIELQDTGTIPAENLKEIIRDRKFEELPSYMKNAVEEAIGVFNRTWDPRQIDLILDKAYFKHAAELAHNTSIDFIVNLFEIIIDITNIITFLRMKRLGMPHDLLQNGLIPGGTIDKGTFTGNYNMPFESFAGSMKGSMYEDICRKGIEDLTNTGSLAVLEKLADNFVLSFARKAKYAVLGIEPLIAYFLAKENEFKNVRIIMAGKVNGVPANIIRERLRDTYA